MSLQRRLMVSFQSQYRDIVRRIANCLRTEGYTVWMDETNMQNYIPSDLAKAIDEADVALVCLSRGYEVSDYCRSESSYIIRSGKKFIVLIMEDYQLNDWVAFYYNDYLRTGFKDEANFENSFQELLRRLEAEFQELSSQVPNPPSDSQATPNNPPPSNPGHCLSQNALLFIKEELGADWMNLGSHLGLKWNEIEKIEQGYRPIDTAIMKMLVTWQGSCSDSENQLELMCTALKRIKNVRLAESLRKKVIEKEL